MSWTDKASIEHIKKIRDIFNVKTFVETGTFKAMNVLAHKDNFKTILSCEYDKNNYDISLKKTEPYDNIYLFMQDSKVFLKNWRTILQNQKEKYIIYLDAHFYDKKRPKGKGKFVVLDELKQLKNMNNVILIIHDFDNNLGHITYDNISLDLKLLKKDLLKVNPNFKFYTNELSSCDIISLQEEVDNGKDIDRYNNLKYAWSKPDKTYRGILYCVPKKINVKGLKEIK